MDYENIAVIGERELVLGFKLIGISDIFIKSGTEAVDTINKLIESRLYGLLLVSESIRKSIDINTARRMEYSLKPLIIFIPMKGAGIESETVEALAKRVLGVDIKGLKGGA
jgi:V/A-type H+-transporting ATPase subunit F